jgi:hypothetical protein
MVTFRFAGLIETRRYLVPPSKNKKIFKYSLKQYIIPETILFFKLLSEKEIEKSQDF